MAFRIRKPSQESFFALNAIPLYSYAIPLRQKEGASPFLQPDLHLVVKPTTYPRERTNN